ncbi:MAG: hypothetical protein IPK13_15190 [Deltaproteobacteria bacterium]|nr:hypothetical protein [Deltaproteobacteria bacterium]
MTRAIGQNGQNGQNGRAADGFSGPWASSHGGIEVAHQPLVGVPEVTALARSSSLASSGDATATDILGPARDLLRAAHSVDALRLPPPPGLNRAGAEVRRGLDAVLTRFEASSRQPTGASAAALEAEARMIAVSMGLLRFHREVQAACEQHRRPSNHQPSRSGTSQFC